MLFDLLVTTDFFTQVFFYVGEKKSPFIRELKEISDTVSQNKFVIVSYAYVKDGACQGIF
jgi:hypothetical protein